MNAFAARYFWNKQSEAAFALTATFVPADSHGLTLAPTSS
jgi:hypothetical protein